MENIEKQVIKDSIKEDKCWCVYMHTNKVNNKVYVGITSGNPQKRWKNGCGYPKKQQPVFYRAIKKYGWDGFEHIIFAQGISEQEAKRMEIALIALYKTNCTKYKQPSYGYNMTDGGDGSVGRMMSDETKRKLSNKLKGKFIGENNPFYGKKHTEETRKKMSEKDSGRTPINKGIPMSDEQKKKISLALQGNVISEYTRQRVSETHRGVPRTETTKQKISTTRKGKYVGAQSSRARSVYCIELHEIFWGATAAKDKYNISKNTICEVCNGSQTKKSAGKHPITREPLHWLYAEEAINQRYITQQDLDNYLNNLRNKGVMQNEN